MDDLGTLLLLAMLVVPVGGWLVRALVRARPGRRSPAPCRCVTCGSGDDFHLVVAQRRAPLRQRSCGRAAPSVVPPAPPEPQPSAGPPGATG